jgi:hypothetical protein
VALRRTMTCHDATLGQSGLALSVSQAQHVSTLIHINTNS